MTTLPEQCTAFAGVERIASGDAAEVAVAVRRRMDLNADVAVLVFDDATGRAVDFDLRGSAEDVRARVAAPVIDLPTDELPPRPRGRPKLGVVAREVTLLPRHWDWLNDQPGGASVALRKLVEVARTTHQAADRIRSAQTAAGRFMQALAGDMADYEEATRALYAGDRPRFEALIHPWPADVRDHALRLSTEAFEPA